MADTLIQGTTIIEDKRTGVAEVWSATGSAFHTDNNSRTFGTGVDDNGVYNPAAADQPVLSVTLPDGVTIDEVIVYGSDSADTWKLYEVILNVSATPTEIAGATLNTTDSSTTKVNNTEKGYFLQVAGLAATAFVYGARIKYTN